MSDERQLCRYCRHPLATKQDVERESDEPGLCWSIVDYCETDAETAIDAHLAEIARLERELQQERQDRRQADLDTIRALGERNDARETLMLAARWGIESDGYSANVSGAIRAWIINGMKGPPPKQPDYYPKP